MLKSLLLLGAVCLSLASCVQHEKELNLVIGSYAEADGPGIYVYRFNTETGRARSLSSVTGIDNPTYLAISPDNKFIYSFSAVPVPKASAFAYAFDAKTGRMNLLNRQETGGSGPCSIWLDSRQKLIATANYSGGNITFFPVEEDGTLAPAFALFTFEGTGPDSVRQTQPHLHSVYSSPDEKYLFANDLGTDRLYKYKLQRNEEDGSLSVHEGTPAHFDVMPGDGPRHSCFHPNGKYMYLIGELSGNVTAFRYEDGNLEHIQSIEADSLHAAGSADIHVSPDGAFVYASNRLQGDGIAIFAVDQANGQLTKVGYQPTKRHPRNFILTPDGSLLLCACRDDNAIQVFRVNKKTGLLEDMQQDIQLSKPVCLKFAHID